MRHSIILIALVTLVIVFPTGCATTSSSSLEAMPSNLNLIQLPGLVAKLDDDLLPQFQQEQKFISKPTFRLGKVDPIKSIALLNIPNPPLFYLGKKIKPLTFLHASTSSKEGSATIVNDTEEHENFDYAAITQRTLIKHLESRGYKVISISVNRGEQHKLLKDYTHLDVPGVDAILDLTPVMVGFKWGPWGRLSDISPYVSVAVRLVSSDSKEVIYEESTEYGYYERPFWYWKGIRLNAPPEHNFSNSKSVEKQIKKAKERLEHGIDTVSLTIVDRISP